MIYRTFQEWKKDGYIVKKGEKAKKFDMSSYKGDYLFGEDQVVPINKNTPKYEYLGILDVPCVEVIYVKIMADDREMADNKF